MIPSILLERIGFRSDVYLLLHLSVKQVFFMLPSPDQTGLVLVAVTTHLQCSPS